MQSYIYLNSKATAGGLNVPNYFNIGASVDCPAITDFFNAVEASK
jgi:hypothetical protein